MRLKLQPGTWPKKPREYRRSRYWLLSLLLLALLPGSATTYLLYLQAASDYSEQLAIRLNNSAMALEQATRLLIENRTAELDKLVEDPELRRLAKALKTGRPGISSKPLDSIARRSPVFFAVLVMDMSSGRHLLGGDFPPWFMERGIPELTQNSSLSLSILEAMPNGERIFLLARRLDSAKPNPSRGVVLVALANLTSLDELYLERSALGATGEAFLTDNHGVALTPLRYVDNAQTPHAVREEPMQDCLRGNVKPFNIVHDYAGAPTTMSYRPVQGYGGCIMVHVRQSELLEHLAGIRNQTIASITLMALFVLLTASIGISKVLQTQETLHVVASTDALTGVTNRGHFMDLLEQELHRARRFEQTACLMMLDIDHFKRINDNHGHATGDAVLKQFASLISRNLRNVDHFGRIGGEEFCIVLPNTRLAGARQFAERLCQSVEATPAQLDQTTLGYTVSIGVTEFGANEKTAQDILERADAALYQAKRGGRNRAAVG